MCEHNIKNWSVLNNLDKDFMKNVKKIDVFGVNGDQVIVITNDDNVYAFGSNSDGCLGLGHTDAVQQPTLIPELCQKHVTKCEFGATNFVLSLTKNGTVFSWGDNTYGQLGNGNTTAQYTPTINTALNDKSVIDIKAGKIHWLALTSSSDVYIIGYSLTTRAEIVITTRYKRYIFNGINPTKMSIPTTTRSKKIVSIDSGLYHALALTDNGDVYCWGDCANGKQMDSYINKNSAMYSNYNYGGSTNVLSCFQSTNWSPMLNVIDIPITEIACGPYHGLMLSSKGNVYCFGDNNFGQCGDATKESKINPTKITKDINFKSIGATNNYDISTSQSVNGFCYVWGKCGETTTYDPIKTPFKKITEALEFYSPQKVTYEPIFIEQNFKNFQNSLIIDRISEKFNKHEYSDIAFKVEDKVIYAQKSHLINVCNHFEVMFAGKNWNESQISEIEIENYSYSVYYAFIKYLYTDCVDVKPEESMQLLDLANCYLDAQLKKRCAEIIKCLISNENVISIYFSAVKYESKELKKFCFEYIRLNMKEDNAENIFENAAKEFAKYV